MPGPPTTKCATAPGAGWTARAQSTRGLEMVTGATAQPEKQVDKEAAVAREEESGGEEERRSAAEESVDTAAHNTSSR